jgi:hypothetical protein
LAVPSNKGLLAFDSCVAVTFFAIVGGQCLGNEREERKKEKVTKNFAPKDTFYTW